MNETKLDRLRHLADPETFAMAQMLVDATAQSEPDSVGRVFTAKVIDDAITLGLANACGRVTLANMHAAIRANGGDMVSREALPGDPEFVPPDTSPKKPARKRTKRAAS
jgi:hypothetical protein